MKDNIRTRESENFTNSGSAISALKEKGMDVTNDLKDLGEVAKEVAMEKVEQLKTQAQQTLEGMKNYSESAQHQLEQKIKHDPVTSILMAAGFGIVVGLLLRRH